ncbi:MAG TPA: aspartyl-phosphate phosphatase Spo0E family protein [Bacillota bacterium]|nr:aspartyl-phosphate phosphatase Spo0E family protein [Bacillota bacterium]
MNTVHALLEQIEILRKRMTKVVREQGVNSPKSIILSQRLDCLLNRYNKKTYKSYKKVNHKKINNNQQVSKKK